MPLPVINHLQMSWKRKLNVIGIFWLGGFCVVAAAVRLHFSLYITNTAFLSNASYTYAYFVNVIWSIIEPCASIVAACLPTYSPLFKRRSKERAAVRRFSVRSLKPRVFEPGPGALQHNVQLKGPTKARRWSMQTDLELQLHPSASIEPLCRNTTR